MNNLWYLKYTHNGNFMKEECVEGFEKLFNGELDHIYTQLGVRYDKVRDSSVGYPFLRRIEVFTKCPEAWEDMMLENFMAERDRLRNDVMKAMGMVTE